MQIKSTRLLDPDLIAGLGYAGVVIIALYLLAVSMIA